MKIERIYLHNFRNYEDIDIHPSESVNILYGRNGSGKTNFLESIHYCALGRSHRTNNDKEVVSKNGKEASCHIHVKTETERNKISIRLTPGMDKKKQVIINGNKAGRISDLMGKLRCVMFSPEDLMIIKEGPNLRRKYLDMMISQISTGYFVALQKYARALDHRNVLLKDMRKTQHVNTDLLDVFEQELIECAKVIVPMRHEVIEKLKDYVSRYYGEISNSPNEKISIRYSTCAGEDGEIEESLKKQFLENRERDILYGSTSVGIHREDMIFYLNGYEMKTFGSQGQIRTAALALKLCQIDIFDELTGEKPVLLLDDVMSELDMTRRTKLIEKISDVQTFITCTEKSDFVSNPDYHILEVKMCEGKGIIHEEDRIASAEEEMEPEFL